MTTATMTPETREYNGWANYETWSVNLIISNEQDIYNEARELAKDTADNEENPELKRIRVADALKDWVRDAIDGFFEPASGLGYGDWKLLAQQLVGGALSDVDWLEIADAMLAE